MDTDTALCVLGEDKGVKLLKEEFYIPYTNYFVAMTAFHPDDPTKLLVIDYKRNRKDPNSPIDIKFPGGTGEWEDTDPFMTLLREGQQEVMGGTPGVTFEKAYPFYRERMIARSLNEDAHIKLCVLVKPSELILPYVFNEGPQTDERERGTNEEISNHRYLSVSILAEKLFFSHRKMLKGLAGILAPYSNEYAMVHMELSK